jgi:hypothetical protein
MTRSLKRDQIIENHLIDMDKKNGFDSRFMLNAAACHFCLTEDNLRPSRWVCSRIPRQLFQVGYLRDYQYAETTILFYSGGQK